MKKLLILLAVGVFLCALSPAPTRAIPLIPGSSGIPNDFNNVVTPYIGATVADTLTVSYTGLAGLFHGSFRELVVRDLNTGHLDFLYEITNDPNSVEAINRFTAVNFTGFTTDIGFDSSQDLILSITPHVDPSVVSRLALGPGMTVAWAFDIINAPLNPGKDSVVMVVKTDADLFTGAHVEAIDGDVSQIRAFGPSAVPEPATMLLLGSGLLGIGVFARRRFKK